MTGNVVRRYLIVIRSGVGDVVHILKFLECSCCFLFELANRPCSPSILIWIKSGVADVVHILNFRKFYT